jgi:hypothetical protein
MELRIAHLLGPLLLILQSLPTSSHKTGKLASFRGDPFVARDCLCL